MKIHIFGQPQTLKGASENRGLVHRLLQLRTYPWVNLNPPGAPNLTATGPVGLGAWSCWDLLWNKHLSGSGHCSSRPNQLDLLTCKGVGLPDTEVGQLRSNSDIQTILQNPFRKWRYNYGLIISFGSLPGSCLGPALFLKRGSLTLGLAA